jgi:hypothetical protein
MKNGNIAIGVEFGGRESSIVLIFIAVLTDLMLSIVARHKLEGLYAGRVTRDYSRDTLIQAPGAERALPTSSIRLAGSSLPHQEPPEAQLS